MFLGIKCQPYRVFQKPTFFLFVGGALHFLLARIMKLSHQNLKFEIVKTENFCNPIK